MYIPKVGERVRLLSWGSNIVAFPSDVIVTEIKQTTSNYVSKSGMYIMWEGNCVGHWVEYIKPYKVKSHLPDWL
jgi:hypothetical protein